MPDTTICLVAIVSGLAASACGAQSEVRYYQQDGVTYRETRATVRRPVSETQIQEHQQTVYRPRYSTHIHQASRTVYTPVIQYHWQARWYGWWNPFQEPYVAYDLEPYTYWQARQETFRMPVSQQELVPEQRTVRVPVTTLRFVEKEEVWRVAIVPPGQAASSPPPPVQTAEGGPIGGIARLDGDPPRQGTGGPWHARR